MLCPVPPTGIGCESCSLSGDQENQTGTFYFSRMAVLSIGETLTEAWMEGMGTEALLWRHMPVRLPNQMSWRRSFDSVRRMANSETRSCCLTPSHHGEACSPFVSRGPFFRAVESNAAATCEGVKT